MTSTPLHSVVPYRGHWLTHIDAPNTPQFITFRLDDALPLHRYEPLLVGLPDEPELRQRHLRKRIEACLDEGYGSCVLADPELAACLIRELQKGAGVDYDLHGWVVMPNHAHMAMTRKTATPLGAILKQWKGASAHAINTILGRRGRLWAPDYYDRLIVSERSLEKVVSDIEANPVTAGLCATQEMWRSSSAFEHAADGGVH